LLSSQPLGGKVPEEKASDECEKMLKTCGDSKLVRPVLKRQGVRLETVSAILGGSPSAARALGTWFLAQAGFPLAVSNLVNLRLLEC
jgi:hypothetical protein